MCYTPFVLAFVWHLVCARILFKVFYASDRKSRQFNEHQLSHGVTAAVMATGDADVVMWKLITSTPSRPTEFSKSTSHPPIQSHFLSLSCCVYFKYEINRDNVRIPITKFFTLENLQSFACWSLILIKSAPLPPFRF